MQKAINAYEHRGEGFRHGIALDKRVTVILSQGDEARLMCGIYFNLHSPYQKDALPKTVKAVGKSPSRKAINSLVAHFIAGLRIAIDQVGDGVVVALRPADFDFADF